MQKLIPGTIIKTNYSDRKHKVVGVLRNCTCPRYTDWLGYTNTGMERLSPEHIHITAKDLEDNAKSWFNGFVELDGKIKSVWTEDEIIIISYPDNYQLQLFDKF